MILDKLSRNKLTLYLIKKTPDDEDPYIWVHLVEDGSNLIDRRYSELGEAQTMFRELALAWGMANLYE